MSRLTFGAALSCAVLTCAVATVLAGKRFKIHRKWSKVLRIVNEFEESSSTPFVKLKLVVDAMAVEMHAGLASDGASKLKMLLSYVDKLPLGDEKGTFYALDLGGPDFRILRVQFGDGKIIKQEIKQLSIHQNLLTGTSKDLFTYIATSLKKFVSEEEDSLSESRELGFTFSFPVKHSSISSGVLIKWTKGFDIKDLVGRDVTQCLEEAMAESGLNMQVATLVLVVKHCHPGTAVLHSPIVNDTVGTLALGHYHDVDTVAAVIIGSGTNACYIEHTDAIIKCQGLDTITDKMVVNIEWGNFWSAHLPRTSYDIDLCMANPNWNEQGYEKLISGMYLGEIVRRVLFRIAEESDIFGTNIGNISTPFVLRTNTIAAMHEDDSPDLDVVNRLLQDNLQMPEISIKARKVVVTVCDIVTRRAARLTAAGIIGILKKIGRDGSCGLGSSRRKAEAKRTVVTVEGDLYTDYSMFREYLNEAVVEILGDDIARNVVLKASEDGSGTGAALLAALFSVNR